MAEQREQRKTENVCGGRSEFLKANSEVQGYLDKVRKDAESAAGRTFSSFEAVEFATQVVAGFNYFIKANTGDGTFAHVVVFKPMQGDGVEFRSIQDKKGPNDKFV